MLQKDAGSAEPLNVSSTELVFTYAVYLNIMFINVATPFLLSLFHKNIIEGNILTDYLPEAEHDRAQIVRLLVAVMATAGHARRADGPGGLITYYTITVMDDSASLSNEVQADLVILPRVSVFYILNALSILYYMHFIVTHANEITNICMHVLKYI